MVILTKGLKAIQPTPTSAVLNRDYMIGLPGTIYSTAFLTLPEVALKYQPADCIVVSL